MTIFSSLHIKMRAAFGVAFLSVFGVAPSVAQEAAPPKRSGPSLFERFAGNTVTGYNTSGNRFTEYHAPDGRIFGYNLGEAATDACWRTNGPNTVCYYYGSGSITGEFCWQFEPVGDSGYKIYSTDDDITGFVQVEPGNPHGWTDQGQSWTCDRLMSSAPQPSLAAALIEGK